VQIQQSARPQVPLAAENPCLALGYRRSSPQTPRHLGNAGYMDYESGSGPDRFAYDVLTDGPIIGISFRF
ncbi:hypothetical protein, partial [Sphingomonas sp. DC2300-3]|uniref:hypothetical protein n=1 Tax=unclassified Sphingomonas TaxID=196159 RepID=UPI003CFB98AA